MRHRFLGSVIVVCCLLPACQKAEKAVSPGEPQASAVLARVEGEEITRVHLEESAKEALGSVGSLMIARGSEDKLVQGLVVRKAMAKLRAKELSAQELASMERKAQAFRERLLAKSYIESHVERPRASEQDVKAYYEAHQERFGARNLPTFELLVADVEAKGAKEIEVLKLLGELSSQKSWSTTVEARGHTSPVRWLEGSSELGNLPPKLQRQIKDMTSGETSGVLRLGSKLYVARVTGSELRKARPLLEVQDEIRQTLKPRAYRDAVKRLQAQVLEQVSIEYGTQPR